LYRATWDEAFAEIKKGIKRIRDEHSPEVFLVSASPKLTNEELYLAGKFARMALGTNNILSFHRLVNGADYHALDGMLGTTASTATIEDLENADLYIVLGGNPTVETPVIGWRMKRRIKNGTPAIVIIPRRLISHAMRVFGQTLAVGRRPISSMASLPN